MLSNATIKAHINHIFAKTGMRDRSQAVRYVYEDNLLANRTAMPTVATCGASRRPNDDRRGNARTKRVDAKIIRCPVAGSGIGTS